jgi:hypothetical protein
MVVPWVGPSLVLWWASSSCLGIMLSEMAPFWYESLVFGVDSCKMMILPIQVEFG